MMKLNSVALLIFSLSFASYAHAEEAMDPEQLFKEAMELKDNGSILGAIEIFETIVSQQPGLNRARLELATAYHQARRYEEARKQLTQVLNDPETPETVKLTITGYLAQLSSDEKTASNRTSSSVYVSAGAFNDSNVNLGPNSELPGTTLEKTGSGVIGMASYSHVSLASKPFHTENSLIDFAWNSQISAYAKSYTSDSDSDFNLQVVSLSTGPALISNSNWSFQFNIKADKVYFGGDSYSFNLGINPKLILHFNNDLQFEIESLSTVREFSFVTDQGLDGISKMYGMMASKFYRNHTLGLNVGLRHHSNGAKDTDLNSSGSEIFVGAQAPAWKNARAYLEIGSRQYNYESGLPAPRDETEQRFLLGVNHDFKSGFLNKWTLNAQYNHTENDSNILAFDYDRNVAEVNIRRYF